MSLDVSRSCTQGERRWRKGLVAFQRYNGNLLRSWDFIYLLHALQYMYIYIYIYTHYIAIFYRLYIYIFTCISTNIYIYTYVHKYTYRPLSLSLFLSKYIHIQFWNITIWSALKSAWPFRPPGVDSFTPRRVRCKLKQKSKKKPGLSLCLWSIFVLGSSYCHFPRQIFDVPFKWRYTTQNKWLVHLKITPK